MTPAGVLAATLDALADKPQGAGWTDQDLLGELFEDTENS